MVVRDTYILVFSCVELVHPKYPHCLIRSLGFGTAMCKTNEMGTHKNSFKVM